MIAAVPPSSALLWQRAEGEPDRVRRARPPIRLLAQLSAAGCGELVVLRAPVVLRRAPLGRQESLVLEAVEGGIQRALSDDQLAARDLLDAEQDAVAVEPPERHGAEHEQVERSGQVFRAGRA